MDDDYETRVTELIVVPKNRPWYDEETVHIGITDEGAGEFLEVWQSDRDNALRINSDEWPAVRDAIERMIAECRDNG